eukprot:gene13187-14536_t
MATFQTSTQNLEEFEDHTGRVERENVENLHVNFDMSNLSNLFSLTALPTVALSLYTDKDKNVHVKWFGEEEFDEFANNSTVAAEFKRLAFKAMQQKLNTEQPPVRAQVQPAGLDIDRYVLAAFRNTDVFRMQIDEKRKLIVQAVQGNDPRKRMLWHNAMPVHWWPIETIPFRSPNKSPKLNVMELDIILQNLQSYILENEDGNVAVHSDEAREERREGSDEDDDGAERGQEEERRQQGENTRDERREEGRDGCNSGSTEAEQRRERRQQGENTRDERREEERDGCDSESTEAEQKGERRQQGENTRSERREEERDGCDSESTEAEQRGERRQQGENTRSERREEGRDECESESTERRNSRVQQQSDSMLEQNDRGMKRVLKRKQSKPKETKVKSKVHCSKASDRVQSHTSEIDDDSNHAELAFLKMMRNRCGKTEWDIDAYEGHLEALQKIQKRKLLLELLRLLPDSPNISKITRNQETLPIEYWYRHFLPTNVLEKGLQPIQVTGDGTCFYRSMAMLLFGKESAWVWIKLAAIRYGLEHKDTVLAKIAGCGIDLEQLYFLITADDEPSYADITDPALYLSKCIRKELVISIQEFRYGTFLHLVLASELFGINIRSYCKYNLLNMYIDGGYERDVSVLWAPASFGSNEMNHVVPLLPITPGHAESNTCEKYITNISKDKVYSPYMALFKFKHRNALRDLAIERFQFGTNLRETRGEESPDDVITDYAMRIGMQLSKFKGISLSDRVTLNINVLAPEIIAFIIAKEDALPLFHARRIVAGKI